MNCIWSGIKLFWTLQNAECQRRETQCGQPVMRNAAMPLREPGTKQVGELLTSLWQPVCYFGTTRKVKHTHTYHHLIMTLQDNWFTEVVVKNVQN